MISGGMTSGVIADSIVNLCGAIGLSVAMSALYRRDPRSPLTQRLLWFALLWLGGVGTVTLISYLLRLWIAPK